MTTTKEALELFEEHRATMLKIARKAAEDLFNETRQPITADDVFFKLTEEKLLTPEQLELNGRWIASVFRYTGSPWTRAGYTKTAYKGRLKCNTTRRATWTLDPCQAVRIEREDVVDYLAKCSDAEWDAILTEAALKEQS